MTIREQPDWDNEEEAEVAQILDITRSQSAVERVQRELAQQRSQPSLEHCEDCGEEIPQQRREISRGCTRCIHCQTLWERRKAGY